MFGFTFIPFMLELNTLTVLSSVWVLKTVLLATTTSVDTESEGPSGSIMVGLH